MRVGVTASTLGLVLLLAVHGALSEPVEFVEVGAERGIGAYIMANGKGASATAADFDDDGDIDFFFPTAEGTPDQLYRNLGGAIGFPLGQTFQAFHAWNPEVFESGVWTHLDLHMNWWNMMEITFGATMGAALGLGLWLNRKKIQPEAAADTMPASVEGLLLAVHVALLSAVAFMSLRAVDAVYDLGLIMGIIPMVALAGSRYWPYLIVFPVTLLPIAGKTLRQLGYNEEAISLPVGWIVYFVVPMLMAIGAAIWFLRRGRAGQTGFDFARTALVLSTWMFFLLNFAFFRFPWPWTDWTGRTPSGIIYTVCALALTGMVIAKSRRAVGR